jgi:hypothetical protein
VVGQGEIVGSKRAFRRKWWVGTHPARSDEPRRAKLSISLQKGKDRSFEMNTNYWYATMEYFA